MSGPDRRDTRLNKGFVGGSDPEMGMDEDLTVTIIGGRKAYHLRCDVDMPLVADESYAYGYFQRADVDSNFEAGLSVREWNGQEVFGTDNVVRSSRAEYTSLDVAGEFLTEED